MNNNDLQNRFKRSSDSEGSNKPEGIFSLWQEQKRIEEEDKKLALELREAKKKARELKRAVYKNKFGESKKASKEKLGGLGEKSKSYTRGFFGFISKRKKLAGVAVLVIVAFASFQAVRGNDEQTALLGEATVKNQITEDLPREKPDFSLLFPTGTDASNYDVVRISPPEADASYTYLDRFTDDGQIFKVTQQEVPDSFNLANAATDFQATSVIQVDDNQIFHGYSEKGGIQSILFVKDSKLILIRSPQKFSDDLWANYYLSLN